MLKIGKKVISALLVLCIVCSVFSVTAFAESDSAAGEQGVQTNIGEDMNIKGTNSFGSLVTSELEQKADSQEENKGFNIFSVEVTGKTAAAEFEALQDSTLVVAIYDESGVEMLASGKAEVTKEDTTAEVTIDIETMPKYFYLRAFLVDEEVYRPLCNAYESPNYTQEMQEFFAKTTDDFESDKVLNLDSDKTNNFAVYDDETKIIEQNGNKNQVASVDDEGQKYVIENADSSITSLKTGDIFSYNYGDDKLLIVKVKSISVSGTTATIYGDEVELEEVFDYVKMDETGDLSNAEVDPSTCDEGVTYEGIDDEEASPKNLSPVGADIEGSIGTSISLEFKGSIQGKFKLGVEAKTKVYVTLQYQYVEFSIKYSAKLSFAIKAKFAEKKFKITTIGISPVPGIYIEFTPSVVVEADVQIELSGTLSGSVGIRATMGSGIEDISKSPSFKSELKVKGTVFIGLSMEPRVGVLSDIVSVGMEAKAGAELEASMSLYDSTDNASPPVKHDCAKCIKGEISIKKSLSADVCFLKMEKLKLKRTFYEKKFKLCDFHYSFDYNEFAFTTCPHQKYRVTVTVKNSKGEAVSGAKVNDQYETDSNGKTQFYLAGGNYKFTAAKDGVGTAKKTVKIKKNAVSVKMRLASKLTDSEIKSGSGDDDYEEDTKLSLGEYHSGTITENGDLYMWGDNTYGQLGDGTTTKRLTQTKAMNNVKAVSLGGHQSGAITENGDLYMWGLNNYGQIGDGTTTDRYTPTKIMSNVKAVSLDDYQGGAITENGDLYMWGENYYGQLGDGTTTDRYTTTKIMSNVKTVSLGGSHSAAITENGDLYMWGNNGYGQLGDGTTDPHYIPEKIMSNVKAVSLGDWHSGAITENGDLYMWGWNLHGALGAGTKTTSRHIPTKIMSNVKAVSLGDYRSGAITENGDLYMWGENYHGQLGDGTHGSTNDRYTPTKIMSNVKAVSLDEWHSGAITENGDLYMWGLNNYGQIGDGTTTDRHTPTKITIPPANAKFLEAVSASGGSKTEAFTGLQPNEVYNFYSMKTKDAENPFGSVNLLYITQATADENGNLSITYKSDESYDKAINFVVPLKQIDVSTAAVTMDNLNYNGQNQYVKPVVTLNGKTLTEGEDYDLSGDYFAKDAGNYTVTISGRGLFTGEVDFNYSVIVPDKFGDVNLDGRSDIQDVTQLQRYLAHMISFNDEQKIIADVNGDGIIAIDDATIIQIYLAEYLQLV